jgi:hypothetical protein
MTPEEAVAQLTSIVSIPTNSTADSIYAAMASVGMPDDIADRAYKLTQVAWGQALVTRLGVTVATTYFCFDAAGEVTETGLLADEPFFRAAVEVARQQRSPGIWRFASMSADVNVVNNALHAGAKPQFLRTTAPAIFLEAPTPSGLEKARSVLAQWLAEHPAPPAPAQKPWWKFWG